MSRMSLWGECYETQILGKSNSFVEPLIFAGWKCEHLEMEG